MTAQTFEKNIGIHICRYLVQPSTHVIYNYGSNVYNFLHRAQSDRQIGKGQPQYCTFTGFPVKSSVRFMKRKHRHLAKVARLSTMIYYFFLFLFIINFF